LDPHAKEHLQRRQKEVLNVYRSTVANGWSQYGADGALKRYVRTEYGPGNGVDFLYADLAAAAPRTGGKRPPSLAEALRWVSGAFRRLTFRTRAARAADDHTGSSDG
jgi:hypothetical protein